MAGSPKSPKAEKNGHQKQQQQQPQNEDHNARRHPRKANSWTRANCLSKLCFMWEMPLFFKGLGKDLTTDDVCLPMKADLSEVVADKLEKTWYDEIGRYQATGKKPSLFRALRRAFIKYYILDGILLFIQSIVCKSFQPVFLALLIEYFGHNSHATREQAYYSASALVGLAFLNIFLTHHTTLRMLQLGMRLRVACCSLVYRKILRMHSNALANTTIGQVINLMSNDVNRFDVVLMYLHHLWIMPFTVALISYFIYTQVSAIALVGVLSITLQTLPVQGYMSKLSSRLRKRIADKTDERVRLMNEIISGIQVIKMYAWEKPFEKIVEKARVSEVSDITKASYLRGIYMSFMVFTERATLYVTILAQSLMGYKITSAMVFSLAQFYNILQAIMAISFPSAISTAAECSVTISRLEEFLTQDERPDLKVTPVNNKKKKKKDNDDLQGKLTVKDPEAIKNSAMGDDIEINNVTAGWNEEYNALHNITITMPRGKLCAIIGPVGSGKSSVLHLLLKELIPNKGTIKMNGTYSYASQEPWLFVGTVRNNILFGLPFDLKRYKDVVKACALKKDFEQFPRGDQTLVGERGVSLSGGQRARINLARAIYKDADIYILDDPLSAVDTHVGRHLYGKCIRGYLKDKTTILVTHQLHYLHTADLIVIMKNGRVESSGTYDELASTGDDFHKLLTHIKESETDEEEKKMRRSSTLRRSATFRRSSRGATLKRNISFNSNISLVAEFLDDELPEELEEEEQITGSMSAGVYYQYWKASGSWCLFIFMSLLMLLGQLSASCADYWVTFWTNQVSEAAGNSSLPQSGSSPNRTIVDFLKPRNSTATPDLDLDEKIGPFNTYEYLYIYTVIIVLCVILNISRAMMFFKVCMNASKGLHNQMFNKILRAVMRFFDTNPSGRILNRFSKDIGAIDELLPRSTIEALQIGLVMISILVLVAITNYWMLIPILVITIVFLKVFFMYLKTAQAIKRLEGIAKSPVFSHVSSSLNGITTIRASNSAERLANEFDMHQNLHTSTWHQYLACSCTLGFWLDFLCALFVAIVSFSFIVFKGEDEPSGDVGLAISQSLILTGMLQYGIRQAAEIVSQMTSVERVLQYNDIEEEKYIDEGEITPPANWPKDGKLKFTHTFMRYSEMEMPVLKDLHLTIEHGWKVGIVGRTGAGKSSLISALFRLAKIEGLIHIDGIETGAISLQTLRSHISIIPQEPVLFSETIRYNLDPFAKYTDKELWDSLEDVELKEEIPSLDFIVADGGANFSLGQRQLVCLARAILKNNQILVLDEATANVDPQTDAFIQRTIREKFHHCTVLTIAHRLNTIMDSDRVLVMDTGKTAEFDHPHVLLANPKGHFAKMVAETGSDMAKTLHQVARDAYVAKGGKVAKD